MSAEQEEPRCVRAASEHRPIKIVCIDDDPKVSDAMSRCFGEFDIEVVRAYDGIQGIWCAQTEAPDAIISDISMPNGDGVEMIECLRHNAQTEFIPILVLTGLPDPQLRNKLYKLGVSAVFEKPTNTSEILIELLEHLPESRSRNTARVGL